MNTQEQRFIDKWEKTRARGKGRYMALIGLVFVVVLPLINVLALYFQYKENYVFNLEDFGSKVLIGLLLGLFLGLTNWSQNERKYKKIKGEEEPS